MGEEGPIARLLDHLPGGPVHLAARDAGPGGGDPRPLGLQHRVVDPLHLISRLAHRHRPGHIRAVALIDTAEVHGHKHPRLDHRLPRHRVGHGAVGARSYDGVKGHPPPAPAQQLIHQPGGDLLLRQPRADEVQDLPKRLVGDALGLAHPGQLLLVLGGPQPVQQALSRHQLTGEAVFPASQLIRTHPAALKTHPLQSPAPDLLPRQGQMALPPLCQHDFRPCHLLPGRLDVPAVSGVVGPVPAHQDPALPLKAHSVALAGGAGDQHGVQAVLRQLCGDFCNMIHRDPLLSKTTGSAAPETWGPVHLHRDHTGPAGSQIPEAGGSSRLCSSGSGKARQIPPSCHPPYF